MTNNNNLDNIRFDLLTTDELRRMEAAATQINECYRALNKGGLNIVGECLKDQGTFYQMEHYPKGDVYDNESFAQYYYHNHREDMDEHGHFHTFMRAGGMSASATPAANDGSVEWQLGENAISHIISISMNKAGFPIGLFATNRWVTGETWYPCEQVIEMLDNWNIDHAHPNLAVNLWISSMLKLFRPQIVALLHQRDKVVEAWRDAHPGEDVFEDRKLEVTGELSISVEHQLRQVMEALGSRAGVE